MSVKEITKLTKENKSIPYVISPRNTFLDTRKPTIRWNKVLSATSYIVKIVRDYEVVRTTEVKGTEFKSSDDLPLESGVAYSVIVESNNGHSSEMNSNQSELEFTVLDEQEILDISNEIEQEKKQESRDNEILSLVRLVDIYRKYGLNAKAIELLEQKTNNSIEPAILYLELGDFYLFTGLSLSAQEQYQKLLSLTKDKQDLKVSLAATTNLMTIFTLLGNQDEAKKLETQLEYLKEENKKNLSESSISFLRSNNQCCGTKKKYATICSNVVIC